jgi:SAM-dependent MidA family methyltransferase
VSNSQIIIDLLIDRINKSSQQRITFADYMNLVLYHPQYGYYSSGTVAIGSRGDFFTSPSLGTDFGELIAEQLIEIWDILGHPNPFTLVEVGAGSGLLAADILAYFQSQNINILNTIEYIIIEQAEGLIARQQALLETWQEKSIKIIWKSWQDIAENSIIGCIFSNELVDALPVHQIAIAQKQIQEIYVTYTEGEIREAIDQISTPKIADYFEFVGVNILANDYPENYRTEVNLAALEWLKTVAQKLKRGYLLTIDYGYNAQRYYNPQRYRGTLQCYYQHRRHDNPYINIGYQDITSHVDFTALERQGELCGLEKLGFTQQGLFLMTLGLGDRISDLSSGKFDLGQILQRRDALHQLIDPAGLGGFGVLIQAKGLTAEEKMRSLRGLKQPKLF